MHQTHGPVNGVDLPLSHSSPQQYERFFLFLPSCTRVQSQPYHPKKDRAYVQQASAMATGGVYAKDTAPPSPVSPQAVSPPAGRGPAGPPAPAPTSSMGLDYLNPQVISMRVRGTADPEELQALLAQAGTLGRADGDGVLRNARSILEKVGGAKPLTFRRRLVSVEKLVHLSRGERFGATGQTMMDRWVAESEALADDADALRAHRDRVLNILGCTDTDNKLLNKSSEDLSAVQMAQKDVLQLAAYDRCLELLQTLAYDDAFAPYRKTIYVSLPIYGSLSRLLGLPWFAPHMALWPGTRAGLDALARRELDQLLQFHYVVPQETKGPVSTRQARAESALGVMTAVDDEEEDSAWNLDHIVEDEDADADLVQRDETGVVRRFRTFASPQMWIDAGVRNTRKSKTVKEAVVLAEILAPLSRTTTNSKLYVQAYTRCFSRVSRGSWVRHRAQLRQAIMLVSNNRMWAVRHGAKDKMPTVTLGIHSTDKDEYGKTVAPHYVVDSRTLEFVEGQPATRTPGFRRATGGSCARWAMTLDGFRGGAVTWGYGTAREVADAKHGKKTVCRPSGTFADREKVLATYAGGNAHILRTEHLALTNHELMLRAVQGRLGVTFVTKQGVPGVRIRPPPSFPSYLVAKQADFDTVLGEYTGPILDTVRRDRDDELEKLCNSLTIQLRKLCNRAGPAGFPGKFADEAVVAVAAAAAAASNPTAPAPAPSKTAAPAPGSKKP